MPIHIPPLLKRNPRFHGFPIPYISYCGPDRIPDFKINDDAKVERAVALNLCGLCGTKLGGYKHLVGGERCAESLCFIDPPMHEQCAIYALKVCPFLVGSKDYVPIEKLKGKPGVTIMVDQAQNTRPKKFFFFTTKKIEVLHIHGQRILHCVGRVNFGEVPVPLDHRALAIPQPHSVIAEAAKI